MSAFNSQHDTISVGNGAGDVVITGDIVTGGGNNDTIIVGNGINDTVRAQASQYDTITLGIGAGDTVDAYVSQYDTIALGDGAGDSQFGFDGVGEEFLAVGASPGWRPCEEVEDGLPDGRHARLWRRSPDSFFSVPLL